MLYVSLTIMKKIQCEFIPPSQKKKNKAKKKNNKKKIIKKSPEQTKHEPEPVTYVSFRTFVDH